MYHQVKVVGINGQVSLGKEFAGKMVAIDQVDENTWVIKSGEFIPQNEKWLHQEDNLLKLEKALKWAEENKPNENFEQFVGSLFKEK